MKKAFLCLSRFFLYISIFLLGAVAGFMLHGSAVRVLQDAWAFGVTDLSESPPERLTEPLVLLGDGGGQGLLPRGTVLYPERAYAEGFVGYILHVNFKGPLPSESADFCREVTAPLWSEPVESSPAE